MRMLLFRLRSSIGNASEVIRRNSMVNASEVLPLHYRALIGNVSQVSRVHSYSRALIGKVSQVSSVQSYSRNSQSSLVQYLDKQIKLVESRCLTVTPHPGSTHAKLIKAGAESDQIICKQLRFYASSGYPHETVKFFNEAYFSNNAGLGVWNCYIISLALHPVELTMVEKVPKALTVFEDMPMVKTHATYWNAMVACSEAGETKYAQYLLAKVFKSLAVEPSIQITGCYIDALAKNGQLEEAFTELKRMVYKPNQEIIVSIIFRYQMHPRPAMFANEVLSYVESQGVIFYIDKITVKKLTEDGVTLTPSVKIKKGRSKGGSLKSWSSWRE